MSEKTQMQDIAVIGGGIIGLTTAYMLARIGHIVTVYDPDGFPATNSASYMAGGMLAPYAEIEHMDMDWVQAGIDSIDIWDGIVKEIGVSGLLHRKGSLLIAHPNDEHMLGRFAVHLPENSAWENLSPSALEPTLPGKFRKGIFLRDEAHTDPPKLMAALCTFLQKQKNVTFKKAAFIKSQGKDFDVVVECSGMAASADDKAIRGIKGEIVYVRNAEFSLSRPVRFMHPRYPLYIVPRGDHIFMVGATNIESNDHAVTLRSAMELMSALYALHPSFGEAEVIEITAGVRPTYPDNLPRIKMDGKTIRCNGLYRHGYLLAPAMAQCVVDIIGERGNSYIHLFKRSAK